MDLSPGWAPPISCHYHVASSRPLPLGPGLQCPQALHPTQPEDARDSRARRPTPQRFPNPGTCISGTEEPPHCLRRPKDRACTACLVWACRQ